MTTARGSGVPLPENWKGDVGLGVSAWLGQTEQSDEVGEPPEWAGPLPETPFVPEGGPDARPDPPRWSTSRRGGSAEGGDSPRPLGDARPSRGSRQGSARASRHPDGGPWETKPRAPKLSPEEKVAAFSPLELEEYARKVILDQLTGQARSRKQLADKLKAKFVPDELIVRLLDRFEEVGLVDDEAFARMWVASRQPGKGLAGRALAQELRRKGIDDEVVKEAISEIDPDDEREAAVRLVARKMRSVARLERQVATRRLVAMLARKGYGAGLAYSVVREALDEAALEDEETEMFDSD